MYDPQSSTLMVDRDVATSDGYSYSVTSAMPDWSPDELRAASDDVPDAIAERYLQLPDDFPELAATEAFHITEGATTPYDKALALQNYLRSDRFTYDREVGAGHSNQALLTFLFETRRGYCEQFAATFAALARSAGLPARVAVGFTPGIQDDNDPTLYIVRGVHAHAWPEVYLGEYGWVPFEPTLDRGPPRGSSWLGIDEQQDTSTGGPTSTDSDPLAATGRLRRHRRHLGLGRRPPRGRRRPRRGRRGGRARAVRRPAAAPGTHGRQPPPAWSGSPLSPTCCSCRSRSSVSRWSAGGGHAARPTRVRLGVAHRDRRRPSTPGSRCRRG